MTPNQGLYWAERTQSNQDNWPNQNTKGDQITELGQRSTRCVWEPSWRYIREDLCSLEVHPQRFKGQNSTSTVPILTWFRKNRV